MRVTTAVSGTLPLLLVHILAQELSYQDNTTVVRTGDRTGRLLRESSHKPTRAAPGSLSSAPCFCINRIALAH